jgi:hypothetical protein
LSETTANTQGIPEVKQSVFALHLLQVKSLSLILSTMFSTGEDYLLSFLFSWFCGPTAGHGLLAHEVS